MINIKKLLNYYSLLLLCFLLSCTNSVVGTYENNYEKGAIHQIIIKSDSTYTYIYKTTVTNDSLTGKWNSSEDGYTLYLDNWRGLGKYNKTVFPESANSVVPISWNTMQFHPDLPDETNFTKR